MEDYSETLPNTPAHRTTEASAWKFEIQMPSFQAHRLCYGPTGPRHISSLLKAGDCVLQEAQYCHRVGDQVSVCRDGSRRQIDLQWGAVSEELGVIQKTNGVQKPSSRE